MPVEEPFGALIIDKPSGPTSHDVVARVRRALHVPRIGHTGTLDPLATGVLVLLLGKATRLAQFMVGDEKEYLADVRLGVETPSYDAATLPEPAGDQRETPRGVRLQMEALDSILEGFRGTFLQTPPPYSAKKIGGTRAYAHARRQEPVELRPVEVTVRRLERMSPAVDGLLRLRIVCSSGFYVRSLAHDIGRRLGCGAHLEALRRLRVGGFSIDEARSLDAIELAGTASRAHVISGQALLGDLPAVILSDEGVRRASHGNWLADEHLAAGDGGSSPRVRLVDGSGELVGVADRRTDTLLHPVVVLR